MITATFRRVSAPKIVESAMMVAMFAGFAHLTYRVLYYGFVPLPFVYDVSDTFMDWFNPAFWAHNGHAYSAYTSIYAPLSFVILEIFGTPGCYMSHPKDGRDCDMIGIVAILACYVACVVLAALVFRRNDRPTALYRTVGFGLGLPLLYALERGNLIMIGMMFFIVFFGGLARSRPAIAMTAALIINMKSYLLFPILSLAIKREWRLLELCGIATVALYLVTLTIYGSGTPLELAHNLNVWFNAMNSVVWDQISYSTTYRPFLQFDAHGYPVRDFIKDSIINALTIFIKTEVLSTRLVCWLCIGLAWLYPHRITIYRLAFFFVMQSFIVDNPGGYGQSFIVFLIFMERWNNGRVGLAIVMAYLISIPTDHVITAALTVERVSWLTQRDVETIYGLTLGSLLRPGFIAISIWALAIDSLIDFHKAFRLSRPQLRLQPRPPAIPAI